jgi:hypothetical protein
VAHKVWKRLEEAYESTTTVKDAKLYIFKDKYDKPGAYDPAMKHNHYLVRQ